MLWTGDGSFCGAYVSHQIWVEELDLQHLPATQDYAQGAFGWKKYGAMLRFCSVLEYILSGSCTGVQLLSLPPCARISAIPSSTEERTAEAVLLIKHIFLFQSIFVILCLDEPTNKGLYYDKRSTCSSYNAQIKLKQEVWNVSIFHNEALVSSVITVLSQIMSGKKYMRPVLG